jgi:glutamate dehydrogenase (NAD(P)+)
LINII